MLIKNLSWWGFDGLVKFCSSKLVELSG